MMLKLNGMVLGAVFIGGVALQAGEPSVLLYPMMKDVVAPQAQILWDAGSRGVDNDGNPDASKLTSADWGQITKAAETMRKAATDLADAPAITVAEAGTKLQDDGAPGASTSQQIQHYIDDDRKAFADHARSLARISGDFLQAAKAHDAAKLMNASDSLNDACEACHVQFWTRQ